MSAGTKLYYSNNDFPETFTEELHRIQLKILDSLLGRTCVLEVIISDPRNVKESIYTSYRRVKVVEKTSNKTIFLGRVEITDPSFSEEYGQILTIKCANYSRELFERKINSDYSGSSLKRSALISQIITDYTYPGTVSQNIEESSSSETISRNYTNYDKTVIQVIEELAQEDPWDSDDPPAGYGYDYYVDDTQTFQYFKRGSRPVGGAAANGLTIALGEAESQSTRSMYYDYHISDQPKEFFTRVTVKGVAKDGTTQGYTAIDESLEYIYQIVKEKVEYVYGSDMLSSIRDTGLILITINQYTGTFTRIEGNFRTCGFEAGQTIITSGFENAGNNTTKIIYSVTPSVITVTETSGLVSEEGNGNERIVNSTNLTLPEYCEKRAKALLNALAGSIIRGECKIVRYPYFGVDKTLVRVGDLIHIHLSTRSIDEDFLVLSIDYEEPPGFATINFVSKVYGRSYSPFELTSIFQGLKTGKDIGRIPWGQIIDPPEIISLSAIEYVIDGGGSEITTGEKGHIVIPFDCVLNEVRLNADQIGSIKIDIWKDNYEEFPPTDEDTICADNEPEIVNSQKYQDNILSSWIVDWDHGDTLAFNVDSCSTITRCTIVLLVTKG